MSLRSADRSWRPDPTAAGRWWSDPWVWGLLAAAALLLLTNLESSGLLWQDEAETAVLAQRTLQFGYPKVFDGINRINPTWPAGPREAWIYHPWGQFYLTAASLAVWGSTTAAARGPFALLGVLAILMTYRVARDLTGRPAVARLAALLMLTSVPFLLHARQCRYYAPAIVCTLWVLWAYWRLLQNRRGAWGWLAAGLIALFHSHHGAFVPTAAALGLHLWHRRLPAPQWRGLIAAGALVLLGTAPWLLILNVAQHQGTFSGRDILRHLQFYARELNHYVVPVQFLLLAWGCRLIRPFAWWRAASRETREAIGLLLLIVACNLVFIIAVPAQRHFRYLIHLLPLLALLQAALLWRWLRARRGWLVVIAALIMASDLLHYSLPYVIGQTVPRIRRVLAREHGLVAPRSLLAEYGYELTHRYRGPLDGIIETLRRRAAPGDTVKIPYGDHAVIFYTGLAVEDLNRFMVPTTPTWIIPRRGWVPEEFLQTAYGQLILQQYDPVRTDAPDLPWENRPDPGGHQFRTVTGGPTVVLYRRRDPAPIP